MQNIVVFGAGKSSGALIEFLWKHSTSENFSVTVADVSHANLLEIKKKYFGVEVVTISAVEDIQVENLISKATLVISMLPAFLHIEIAKNCIAAKKNLITPSYISPEMETLKSDVEKSGLLFLNEMGLDPGIDHLSACEMIHAVQQKGGSIKSFKSHCGGLVAQESNDNPWGYKFSWNPRNVVLAGQGNDFIKWKENGRIQYLPYHRLFASSENIDFESEQLESYPNRDSLIFIEPYGLQQAQTVYRGTLRYRNFSESWNLLVQLGLCNNHTEIELSEGETKASFLTKFVQGTNELNLEHQTAKILKVDLKSISFQNLKWLGLFSNEKIILSGKHTPAAILQSILEEKWKLKEGDKDRVVMIHEMIYQHEEMQYKATAILDIKGNERHTAMAETVGLPIAIAARMMLKNQIKTIGVIRPVIKEIYEPVLAELSILGISFKHFEKCIN